MPIIEMIAGACEERQQIPVGAQAMEGLTAQELAQDEMPHRHRHFEVIWMNKGYGRLEVDGKTYEMTDNSLCFIVPGVLHQLEVVQPTEGYRISFVEDVSTPGSDDFDLFYRAKFLHLLMKTPVVQVRSNSIEGIADVFRRLHKELSQGYFLGTEIARSYINILMMYLARHFSEALQRLPESEKARLVQRFVMLVEDKYLEWKFVGEYACELCVSPAYLNEAVKKISGYAPGYHIRQRLILEAKRRAALPGSNMKAIADHLGFHDISHFSKFFKMGCGKNFSEFRKANFL